MKTIQLTKGMVALVDDEDFERVNALKWHASNESRGTKWYAVRRTGPRNARGKLRMSHFVLNVTTKTLDGLVVHHVDDNGLNNQKHNLEIITQRQNMLACKNWCRKKEEPFL